jgi:PAS domain S-box-containing protein
MSMVDVLAPEDLTRAWEERNAKFSGRKRITDYEVTVIRPSGERRLIQIRSTLIGTVEFPLGTHGIARDITEERERESEIRMLATALEKLETAVSISEADGTLVYANAAHRRVLGNSPVAVEAEEPEGMVGARADRPSAEEIFRTVLAEGSWTGRVLRRRRDNGRIAPFECVLGRLDLDRTHPLVFAFARDVSGAVETERQFRRIERLASVGTMIGGIAHELNNPLHAVRNFAELMLMEPRNKLDTEALEIIRQEADRAAKVVADLRVFAREDEGETKLRVDADVNDLIRNVVGLRRYGMETRGVEITEELSEPLPRVALNPAEMEQVILELIQNAEQAMVSRPGEKRLTLATRSTPTGIEIQVRDTGPGIPADVQERIFDPFFTTRDPGEGTGLGLPRVHTIVREHGGEIQVRSEEPRGTAFILELPCEPVRRGPPPEAVTPSNECWRILFIDDEDALRRAAVRFFEHLGHHVRVASEGAEALRLLDQEEFDAIVSDLRMPGMDGETLLQRLDAEGKGRGRKVIFVTGDATSAAARMLADRGVPVLYKPVHLEQIALAIDRLLAERCDPAGESSSR